MGDLVRSNSLAVLAARIRTYHEATTAALKASVVNAMAAGDLLIEAKAQLKHGQWLPWLEANCAMSERTARLYMRLARYRPEIENGSVADLSLRGAIALITLPKDNIVALLGDEIAEAADCESAFVACKKAEAERNVRKALFAEIFAALDRLRPDTASKEAAWERYGDEFCNAARECRMALEADLDLDIPFTCTPEATAALTRARGIAVEMLKEISAVRAGNLYSKPDAYEFDCSTRHRRNIRKEQSRRQPTEAPTALLSAHICISESAIPAAWRCSLRSFALHRGLIIFSGVLVSDPGAQ
jgi:hypothetical protein